MPEIHALETVSLREAWPDEARNFTPWLAGHLELLGAELALDLEQPQVEATLPGAGRVDILARQSKTGASVVIENQLEVSDDSHLLHLLGYAANAGANILVWVAKGFTDYHRSILSWFNSSDTIDVYAVSVNAYRVGDALAADFRTVVEPPQSRPGTSTPVRTTMSTQYAEFYRPLVAQLQRLGLQPVGRGGWRGRWRSFQTDYPQAIYATGLNEGKAQLFLCLRGNSHQDIYHALIKHRAEIDDKLVAAAAWEQSERESWVMLQAEGTTTGMEEDLETVRQWMADNLIQLQAAVQPYLDQAMGGVDTRHDDAEDAG